MKRTFAILVLTSLLTTLSCGTGNVNDDIAYRNQDYTHDFTASSVVYETAAKPVETVLPVPPPVEVLPAPVPAPAPVPLWPRLGDKIAFSKNIFDETIDVAPWHANYVGSYGVLPSRVATEGPFLYSFETSPKNLRETFRSTHEHDGCDDDR